MGGTYWTKKQIEDDRTAQHAPRMVPIVINGKSYTEALRQVRVSPDGVFAAVVLQNYDIVIYRFQDKDGNLLPDKLAMRPVVTLKRKAEHMTDVIDLFLFKRLERIQAGGVGGIQYCLYLVFKNGVLLYQDIEKRPDPIVIIEDVNNAGTAILSRRCCDCDYKTG